MRKIKKHKSFTLIELLIVIAIIGILASIILVSLRNAIERARYARVQQELGQLSKAVSIAKITTGKYLWQISDVYTYRSCVGAGDLRNIPITSPCYLAWQTTLEKIEDILGDPGALTVLKRDPWGSPYLIDENEGENGETDCRHDVVFTAGPNGLIDEDSPGSDDYPVFVEHLNTHPICSWTDDD